MIREEVPQLKFYIPINIVLPYFLRCLGMNASLSKTLLFVIII